MSGACAFIVVGDPLLFGIPVQAESVKFYSRGRGRGMGAANPLHYFRKLVPEISHPLAGFIFCLATIRGRLELLFTFRFGGFFRGLLSGFLGGLFGLLPFSPLPGTTLGMAATLGLGAFLFSGLDPACGGQRLRGSRVVRERGVDRVRELCLCPFLIIR